jgi:hypothetical protein
VICRHRARRALLGELHAAGGRELEQLLALLALASGAHEQPAEEHERHDRSLDHHDRSGDALVGRRRDVPGALAGGVPRIERRARPQQHVGQHGLDEAHEQHVGQPGEVAEPGRLGQRAEQRHPHGHATADEHDVLESVDPVVLHGALVQRGQVPDVEVDGPQRQRDGGMREHPQPPQLAHRQQRLQDRPGQAEDQQQRADVGDQQVLDHVHREQLVADGADRAAQRDQDQRQPAVPAPLAPRGRVGVRMALPQRARAQEVHERAHQRRHHLDRGELVVDVRRDPHLSGA